MRMDGMTIKINCKSNIKKKSGKCQTNLYSVTLLNYNSFRKPHINYRNIHVFPFLHVSLHQVIIFISWKIHSKAKLVEKIAAATYEKLFRRKMKRNNKYAVKSLFYEQFNYLLCVHYYYIITITLSASLPIHCPKIYFSFATTPITAATLAHSD